MRLVTAAAAIVAALASPTAADAATSYVNPSSSNGAYVVKSGSTLQRFEIFCKATKSSDEFFDREFAFSLRDVVTLKKKGKFTYSGKAYRYGTEHQPREIHSVKLSGRVTSTAVRVKWSLPGCGSGSVTAPRQ
jgi:hypothetical protein